MHWILPGDFSHPLQSLPSTFSSPFFSHMNLLQMKTALLIGLCNAPLLQRTHRGEMDESFYIQPYLRMLIASCHGITPERKGCPGCKAQGVFPFPLFQCQLDYHLTSGLTAGGCGGIQPLWTMQLLPDFSKWSHSTPHAFPCACNILHAHKSSSGALKSIRPDCTHLWEFERVCCLRLF